MSAGQHISQRLKALEQWFQESSERVEEHLNRQLFLRPEDEAFVGMALEQYQIRMAELVAQRDEKHKIIMQYATPPIQSRSLNSREVLQRKKAMGSLRERFQENSNRLEDHLTLQLSLQPNDEAAIIKILEQFYKGMTELILQRHTEHKLLFGHSSVEDSTNSSEEEDDESLSEPEPAIFSRPRAAQFKQPSESAISNNPPSSWLSNFSHQPPRSPHQTPTLPHRQPFGRVINEATAPSRSPHQTPTLPHRQPLGRVTNEATAPSRSPHQTPTLPHRQPLGRVTNEVTAPSRSPHQTPTLHHRQPPGWATNEATALSKSQDNLQAPAKKGIPFRTPPTPARQAPHSQMWMPSKSAADLEPPIFQSLTHDPYHTPDEPPPMPYRSSPGEFPAEGLDPFSRNSKSTIRGKDRAWQPPGLTASLHGSEHVGSQIWHPARGLPVEESPAFTPGFYSSDPVTASTLSLTQEPTSHPSTMLSWEPSGWEPQTPRPAIQAWQREVGFSSLQQSSPSVPSDTPSPPDASIEEPEETTEEPEETIEEPEVPEDSTEEAEETIEEPHEVIRNPNGSAGHPTDSRTPRLDSSSQFRPESPPAQVTSPVISPQAASTSPDHRYAQLVQAHEQEMQEQRRMEEELLKLSGSAQQKEKHARLKQAFREAQRRQEEDMKRKDEARRKGRG